MKKIVISLSTICLVAMFAIGATVAYFQDTETSTGNFFTAGKIDLKVDNMSYYNGEFSPDNSWNLTDLDNELFFSFFDVKPGHWGEDTISFHVIDNPAWLCADFLLTKDDDISTMESELDEGDAPEDPTDYFDGELAGELEFIFWADNGNNVLETEEVEKIFFSGTGKGLFGDQDGGATHTLADSTMNVWSGLASDPVTTAQPYWIGKAWCFGDLTLNPVETGFGISPMIDPGILCDGAPVGNLSQSDGIEGTLSFRIIQAQNLSDFQCEQL
jgi:predicted ribosomally synthesized peptide with SipW-like signal peptide